MENLLGYTDSLLTRYFTFFMFYIKKYEKVLFIDIGSLKTKLSMTQNAVQS